MLSLAFHPTLIPTGYTRGGKRLFMTVRTIRHTAAVRSLHVIAAGLPARSASMGQDHTRNKQGPPFAPTN